MEKKLIKLEWKKGNKITGTTGYLGVWYPTALQHTIFI